MDFFQKSVVDLSPMIVNVLLVAVSMWLLKPKTLLLKFATLLLTTLVFWGSFFLGILVAVETITRKLNVS